MYDSSIDDHRLTQTITGVGLSYTFHRKLLLRKAASLFGGSVLEILKGSFISFHPQKGTLGGSGVSIVLQCSSVS